MICGLSKRSYEAKFRFLILRGLKMSKIRSSFLLFFAVSILTASPTIAFEAPNDCAVKEFTFAKSIAGKEPVDRAPNFRAEDKNLIAFIRMSCTRIGGDLHFTFYRNKIKYVDLPIKPYVGENVRLWTRITARRGDWNLEVALDGTVILEERFVVY